MPGQAQAIAEALLARRSFIVTSHARPDGDAVGSSMAMALALEATGRQATVVLKDPVPGPFQTLPHIDSLRVVDAVANPVAPASPASTASAPSSTSITIRATRPTVRGTGSTPVRRPAARWLPR